MSDVAGVRGEMESLLEEEEYYTTDEQPEIAVHREVLKDWIQRLRREPYVREARPGSVPMSMEIADEIRRLDAEGLNHQQISSRLNINSGRVSEVLNGLKWRR